MFLLKDEAKHDFSKGFYLIDGNIFPHYEMYKLERRGKDTYQVNADLLDVVGVFRGFVTIHKNGIKKLNLNTFQKYKLMNQYLKFRTAQLEKVLANLVVDLGSNNGSIDSNVQKDLKNLYKKFMKSNFPGEELIDDEDSTDRRRNTSSPEEMARQYFERMVRL